MDPCWNIEDIEGFEEYYSELKNFHEKQELEWEEKRKRDYKNKIDELYSMKIEN